MAVTFQDVTFTHNSGVPGGPPADMQVDYPATVDAGDWLVFFVINSAVGSAFDIGSPNVRGNVGTIVYADNHRLQAYVKKATGAEGGGSTSFTFWDPAISGPIPTLAAIVRLTMDADPDSVNAFGEMYDDASAYVYDTTPGPGDPDPNAAYAVLGAAHPASDAMTGTWSGTGITDRGIEVLGADGNGTLTVATADEFSTDPGAFLFTLSAGNFVFGVGVEFQFAGEVVAPAEGSPGLDLRLTRMVGDQLPYQVHTGMLGMGRRRGREA